MDNLSLSIEIHNNPRFLLSILSIQSIWFSDDHEWKWERKGRAYDVTTTTYPQRGGNNEVAAAKRYGSDAHMEQERFIMEMRRTNISNNVVGGAIRITIGNLSKIEYLDLSTNSFEGVIPSEIGRLTSLQYLNLNNNSNLTGAIPLEISYLQKLWYLDLGGTF
ncbi:MDIS1-interacting receptor like kinase 2-like protein [Tanacetum coccineum]